MKEICDLLNIVKTRTTAYHPQCDGLVERFNWMLKHMLATTLKDYPFDWEQRLRKVCMAYNSGIHSSTGYTPYYLLFGHEARLPVDLMYDTGKPQSQSVQNYAAHLRQSLSEAHYAVREQLNQAHARQKEFYDRKVHGHPYKEGDLVWLFNPTIPPGQSAKLYHPWTGPYNILEKLSDVEYKIEEMFRKKPSNIVHFNRLKRCHPDTRFPRQTTLPEDLLDRNTEYLPLYSNYELELVEEDCFRQPLRRSTRNRQQPDRYQSVMVHGIEFGANSSEEEVV